MSNSTKFFNAFQKSFQDDLHTALIAKIETFDPVKMKASIKPLNKVNNEELPIIPEVPVMMLKAGNFFIRPPYQKGDIVYVIFAEHDIDNIMLTGKEESSNSQRKHSYDDAIVVGGIMPYTQSLTSDYNTDLVIAKSDMTSKVILRDSGDIIIESAGDVLLGSETASEGVPKGDSLKTWLDSHTHIGYDGITTSTPNNGDSPAPSSKVKVV